MPSCSQIIILNLNPYNLQKTKNTIVAYNFLILNLKKKGKNAMLLGRYTVKI